MGKLLALFLTLMVMVASIEATFFGSSRNGGHRGGGRKGVGHQKASYSTPSSSKGKIMMSKSYSSGSGYSMSKGHSKGSLMTSAGYSMSKGSPMKSSFGYSMMSSQKYHGK